MDERNEQIKQGVVEGVEVIQSGAAAGHEIMQVFATSVVRRVPDVRTEELQSMVIAMLGEIQRNYERANKTKEFSMKFAEPNRSNEAVRKVLERGRAVARLWPEDFAARMRTRRAG
jgi:hypothetical protein